MSPWVVDALWAAYLFVAGLIWGASWTLWVGAHGLLGRAKRAEGILVSAALSLTWPIWFALGLLREAMFSVAKRGSDEA